MGTRETDSMADKTADLVLDRAQVKKAVQALLAFLKSKATPDSLLLDDTHHVCLLFTLWKIPKQPQSIRIPLLHGQRTDTDDICLFTRDEPNMTSDQTQRFYKKLLEERGVKNVTEIIPFKVLKTEYKPHEAKRRLLGNYDLFLSDERIRRLLPSHLGKHFYERKKEPLSVNLQSKELSTHMQGVIQGSYMRVTNKGSCCMARVAHSGMTADEITDNIEAAVKTVVTKLRTVMKGPVMKIIHIKSEASVALPIYTSNLSHLPLLDDAQRQAKAESGTRAAKKSTETAPMNTEDEEEIPQLVPIGTPSKKPRIEAKRKFLRRQSNGRKSQKSKKSQGKNAGKPLAQNRKRKLPKAK